MIYCINHTRLLRHFQNTFEAVNTNVNVLLEEQHQDHVFERHSSMISQQAAVWLSLWCRASTRPSPRKPLAAILKSLSAQSDTVARKLEDTIRLIKYAKVIHVLRAFFNKKLHNIWYGMCDYPVATCTLFVHHSHSRHYFYCSHLNHDVKLLCKVLVYIKYTCCQNMNMWNICLIFMVLMAIPIFVPFSIFFFQVISSLKFS